MAEQIRLKVLRAYTKNVGGTLTVVPVGAVLDEDRHLAINLITSHKAERTSSEPAAQVEPAEPVAPAENTEGRRRGRAAPSA